MKRRLTGSVSPPYLRSMPQRNIHRSVTAMDRPATVGDSLWLRGMPATALNPVLVRPITSGGAG